MIGAALIGTGGIARSLHISGHRACAEHSRLIWVCDTNAESARTIAKACDIPNWTTDLSDILEDSDVAWVDVATPNRTHESIVVQALEAGKHVLCQKPMAHSIEAGERMVAASQRAGRNLGIYMSFRGDGAYGILKRLIDERRLGSLITLRGKQISGNGFKLQEDDWRNREAAGALDQLGVHLIDLIFGLAGPIQWVQAYSGTFRTAMRGDDVTTAIYGLPDNVSAVMETLYCAYTAPHTPHYFLEANGTRGYFRYWMEAGDLEIQMDSDDIIAGEPYHANEIKHYQVPPFTSTTRLHEQFVQAILQGTPPLVTGEDALAVMRAMEATRKAACEHKRIYVVDFE